MKVTFKYGIGSFSGTVENATYWATARKTASIMRRWVMPTATDQNTELGTIATNLASIWAQVTPEYIGDMKTYCRKYFSENTNPEDPFASRTSTYAMWVKMMYAFGKANDGTVDLKTITMSDIKSLYENELENISAQITEGYLSNVSESATLVATMWTP